MLNLKYLEFPSQSQGDFKNIDFESSTWIVSDLDSKFKLRESLLLSRTLIPEDTVLRVHELWKSMLLRLNPSLRIISRDVALAFVQKILEKDFIKLNKPGVADLALNYITFLMPILAHSSGAEALQDYFESNPISKKKWGHWYSISEYIFREFQKENCVLSEWSTGILVNVVDIHKICKKKLFFDLGANLTSLESEIIITLSKYIDVTVFVPNPCWKVDFGKTLNAYEILDADFLKKKAVTRDTYAKDYIKVSTQLGEVKAAITFVRKWLDEGVLPSDIAILAPDIGVYWPVLHEFLNTEGIPSQRPVRAPFKTFSSIQSWLSKLKTNLSHHGQILSSDLESGLYSQNIKEPILPYEDFRQTFSKIYDWNDLKRDKVIWTHFSKKSHSDGEIPKDEFIRWAVKFWDSSENSILQSVLSDFYQNALDSTYLSFQQWFDILDSVTGRKEAEIMPGCKNGIFCLDISSAKEINAKKVFMLGMSESQLKKQFTVHLDDKDIYNLKRQYGFVIPHPENINLEFEARWLLENIHVDFILSYAQSDFDGNALAPCIHWLQGALFKKGKNPDLYVDFDNRKSQLYLDFESLCSEKKLNSITKRIDQDLGKAEQDKVVFMPKRVSPTLLEDHLRCPFTFSTKEILHLSDLPEVDLDIDFMTRGRLLHELFNLILDNLDVQYSDEQILSLIDNVKESLKLKIGEESLWSSYRLRYLQYAKQFIQFEKEWRKKYPSTRTIHREKPLRGYINLNSGEMTVNQSEGSIEFKGKVDRVDINEAYQAVLIDYKMSSQSYSNYKNWISKQELQLALYSMAIEKGLFNDSKNYEIVAAIYYSIKDLNRDKGFFIAGDHRLFENIRKRDPGSEEEKLELFKNLKDVVRKILLDMQNGIYHAQPINEDECERCNWRDMCRAPHLN